MNQPLTTPCAHNLCKSCLENAFEGQSFAQEWVCQNGRRLRSKKNVLTCPACPTDISEFLRNPQVNREIMEVIEKLQSVIDAYANGDAKGSEENSSRKGQDDTVDRSNEEAESQPENPLKRKSSSPSLSDEEENSEIAKRSKVDAGDSHENTEFEK